MSEQIDLGHYPEIVENDQGTRRLELLGMAEQLHDPADRRKLFAGMTDEQFTKMVSYVNSITRGQKISYEYEDGQFPMDATPPLEDKASLMKLTFAAVRDITSNPDFDDRTALRRAGLTLAGAMNYIHPKDDGNGRTGRVCHYLVEFGTERGEKAFNEETYALIAGLSVYDSDEKTSIYDAPPPHLGVALDQEVERIKPDIFKGMPSSEAASIRAIAFLKMMRGVAIVPINERAPLARVWKDGKPYIQHSEPGEMDGVELYEHDYLRFSAIPGRLPSEVPGNAHRVMADKPDEPTDSVRLPFDTID